MRGAFLLGVESLKKAVTEPLGRLLDLVSGDRKRRVVIGEARRLSLRSRKFEESVNEPGRLLDLVSGDRKRRVVIVYERRLSLRRRKFEESSKRAREIARPGVS
jgi:hypothetical protein